MYGGTRKKLDILEQSASIDAETKKFVIGVDEYLMNEFSKNELNDEMLLIHLSISISRSKKKSEIDKMPDDLWHEVVHNSSYVSAVSIWDKLKLQAPELLSENETKYVLLHMTNLIGGL